MKCLRVSCGNNLLLLDLLNVVEVLDSDQAIHVNRDKVIWRDIQISYINLSEIFSANDNMSKSNMALQYVVVAPQDDISVANYSNAQMIAVDELQQLIDIEDVTSDELLNFNNQLLDTLISRAIYDDSIDAIQLYLNLPLNISEISDALVEYHV